MPAKQAIQPVLAAHGLDDDDAAVAFGGGAEPVDGLDDDVDGRVEAEGEVGDDQVVVDGLGDADDGQLEVVVEAVGDAQGVVAADGDQGVEAAGRAKFSRSRGMSVSGFL